MNHKQILMVLSTLLLYSCREKIANEENLSTIPQVDVYICETSCYIPEINSFGIISPVRKADILPPFDSIIRKMYFNEGELINKGDILAQLDRQQIDIQIKEGEALLENRKSSLELSRRKLAESRRNVESRFYAINSAEIELSKKEAELNRMDEILRNKKELLAMGGITKDEYSSYELNYLEKESLFKQARCNLEIKKIGFREQDLINEGYAPTSDPHQQKSNFIDLNTKVMQAETKMAESDLETAVNSLESLRLYGEENTIRSPLTGIIVRRLMDEGEKASRDKPLYHICSYDQVYARCRISENELATLKLEQRVEVKSPVTETLNYGTISRISPWIESDTGSAEVLILLDNIESSFRFGQFVQVRIELGKKEEELVIPEGSVIDGTVYLIRDKHIFKTRLTSGNPRDGMISVSHGLSPGDRIVLSPHIGFIDGMEVRLP